MTPDMGPGIRAALIADSGIVSLLSMVDGVPAVFTKDPANEPEAMPQIVISADIVHEDMDHLSDLWSIVTRYVRVYGRYQDHYRDVDSISRQIRSLFHRRRLSIEVSGYHVARVICSGPIPAPTSDDEIVGRVVTLEITVGET